MKQKVQFHFIYLQHTINCQMAQRTISVNPIDSSTRIEELLKEFQAYKIEKIAISSSKNTAYIQFSHSNDVQSLANRYPDCKVPTFNNAQIGFVSEDFTWPQIVNQQIEVNENSLLVIKNCDKLSELNEEKIRFIFKQYTIKRMIILKDSRKVVLEFQNSQDLELLDMSFEDFKVPALGINAEIDIENGYNPDIFKQKYLENKNHFVVFVDQKGSTQINNQNEKIQESIKREKIQEKHKKQSVKDSKVSQQANIQKKMREMEKQIIQKDRLRQIQNQKLQKQRQQIQKKQRQQRLNRQKQEKRVQKQQVQRLKKKQQQESLKLQQQIRKKQEEEAQLKYIQQKIANVKKQFDQIERKQLESAVQLKQQYDLEKIINQEKQGRNLKTIQLASIHSKVDEQKLHQYNSNHNQTQLKNKHQKIQKKAGVKLDYSKIPYNFIAFVLIMWIYYVITK